MAIAFYNNKYVDGSQPLLTVDDRSLRYGDGIFESMVAFDGIVPLLPYHYERMQWSCEMLQMKPPSYVSFDWLKETISQLLQKNGYKNARIRMQVSRSGGGYYLPTTNDVDILITCTEIANNAFEWSSIKADFSPHRIDFGVLSNLKTTSKVQYVMSSLHAQKIGAQECFLFNFKGTLAEAISSNVFIISGDTIVTPALTNGGVNGVMRRYVISLLEKKYKMVQADVLMKDIDEADEIFLTNAVRGVQSVAVVGSVVYSDRVTRDIFATINDSIKQLVSEGKVIPPLV
jgi:branched-chain amino acid aminotransferase